MAQDAFDTLDAEQIARLLAVGTEDKVENLRDETVVLTETQATPDAIRIEGYQILEQLGQGGMGTVFKALQLSTQRMVAIKVLTAANLSTEKMRIRFEREVELTARLEHPNIARIYESGLERGAYYYTMELIEGEALDDYVRRSKLDQRAIIELMHKICLAVQFAHQQGVIHRDLKPANILVTADGQPHILDFGLAKPFLQSDLGMTVSIEGDIAGTPAYMSPEQAAGELDTIDTRTDVYSLGATFFNLLLGRSPFDLSGSHLLVLKRIQEENPILPSRIIARFDADLEAVLLKSLEKKPECRYQSVAELASDLQAWMTGLPIIARTVTSLYLIRKLISRHRYVSIVLGLLLLIIISTSAISLYSYDRLKAINRQLALERDQGQKNIQAIMHGAQMLRFESFLTLWQSGAIEEAREKLNHLDQDSLEVRAASFLLAPGNAAEKKGPFQAKLNAQEAKIVPFLMAEDQLKHGRESAAIESYQKFLTGVGNDIVRYRWYGLQAQKKLNQLSPGSLAAPNCLILSEGETNP